jgi:hypothetical protein
MSDAEFTPEQRSALSEQAKRDEAAKPIVARGMQLKFDGWMREELFWQRQWIKANWPGGPQNGERHA